jgi:small-conductance mechanosensitive channel
MRRSTLYIRLILTFIAAFAFSNAFSQSTTKKVAITKRNAERKAIHTRDSIMRTLNKSDTSLSSLLQRVEQYTTNYNQIKNTLAQGLDTSEVSQQLPPVIKRIDKISSVANAHKSSTFRYLFVLRDNLDHIQADLEGWQSDMNDVNTKLVQNQRDLLKFYKDTILKNPPQDSTFKKAFFAQLKDLRILWHHTDSTNRAVLLRVNLLQDKIAVAYTKTLDESDQIDSKIKEFTNKAISGESDYIWFIDPRYNDFNSAFNSTIKLNTLLFNYFIKSETLTHLAGFVFFAAVFIWIIYYRTKALKDVENPEIIATGAKYIYKWPILSCMLVASAITPYFYDHPPAVFLEMLFFFSIVLAIILIRKHVSGTIYKFLLLLFGLAIAYGASNLFIQISNFDRYLVFLLSIVSIIAGYVFYNRTRKEIDGQFLAGTILKVFVAMQVLSLLLNTTGRFSLAKIIGVTSVFNLGLLVILYLVVNILVEGLFLQFQVKRNENNIINWIDHKIVEKKIKNALIVGASLLWGFFLLQNLNIDDWAINYAQDVLDQAHSVGGATFTFGGFVIFIFVIWLSSVASKVISYLYDVSAQRVTDLSVSKKRNRTSALIIRIGVFSVGFLLAIAASNFPLDKLTIIISAFGVGIGFGLQNIVNNLVSGLILAFEKPIQIGDVIEVDGHTGTMKEIGIRSSKVITGDGSEVIIPNGDLISHQVINWTLSNSNRQIELRVITAYGVDINKVKDALKAHLLNRNDIMTNPAPAVFINNVNENAVEFKVLFWVADINTTGELKSRVLSELYQDISNQGIPLPSTQKDVYVHFPDGVPTINSPKTDETKQKAEKNKGINENLTETDQ